jgi:TorA maturation chaperone TorD
VTASVSESAAARGGAYELFARLALSEVDGALLRSLRGMPVFGPCLEQVDEAALLQGLRAEYARIFLMTVFPYESVYLDDSAMLNTARSAGVLEHFRGHGFDPPELRSVAAPDHLGLELLFMAHLVDRQAAAARISNLPVSASLLRDQRHFLFEHLARWGPVFGLALAETARTQLYVTLGEALAEFLLGDLDALSASDSPV